MQKTLVRFLGEAVSLENSFPWKLHTLVLMGFSGSSDGEESACNVGDLGLIPRLGRSPGRGHGNPLQYSCVENPRGQRSLVGYSPCSPKELDTTERLSIARHIEAVAVISNSLSFCSFLLFSCQVVSNSLRPLDCSTQASLPFTVSQSLLKFMSFESDAV